MDLAAAAALAPHPLSLSFSLAPHTPPHLPKTDFGFDPLGLSDPEGAGGFIDPSWLSYSEVIHGRWAMLGAAGVLGKDLLGAAGVAGPAARVPWYEAGAFTYFAPAKSLFIAQLFLFGRVAGSQLTQQAVDDTRLLAGCAPDAGGVIDHNHCQYNCHRKLIRYKPAVQAEAPSQASHERRMRAGHAATGKQYFKMPFARLPIFEGQLEHLRKQPCN